LSVASVFAVGSSSLSALAEELSDSPAGAESKAEPTEAAPSRAEGVERHGSAFVDPLGFALFGPRLGVEAGAGHFSAGLSARWFNAGLLAHRLFAKGDDRLAFSYGVALRGRYYVPEGLEGVHLGVATEFLHSRVEDPPLLIATNLATSCRTPKSAIDWRLVAFTRMCLRTLATPFACRATSRICRAALPPAWTWASSSEGAG
jgi:hypothetical protein